MSLTVEASTHEVRRWCSGDGEWSNWQPCTAEKAAEYEKDGSLQVRRLATPQPPKDAGAVPNRDIGGRIVREAWVRWALTQPDPKPSWLSPYDELSDPDKEADRQIFEACAREATVRADAVPAAMSGKYGEVLRPFLAMMEHELHANEGKGDRPGWLTMSSETAMLEIYYHVAKLQKAVRNGDVPSIGEYSADVANMAMMVADIFCALITPDAAPLPQHPPAEPAARAQVEVGDAAALKLASKIGVFYHNGKVNLGAPLYAFTPDELTEFSRRLAGGDHA